MSISRPEPFTVALDRALDTELVQTVALEQRWPGLTAYLSAQRWFGDKDRSPRDVRVFDAAVGQDDRGWYILAFAIVSFTDASEPAAYLLLFAVIPDEGQDGHQALLRLHTPKRDWLVADIARAPGFPTWWLNQFVANAALRGTQGVFRWARLPGFELAAPAAGPGRLILGGMGQSNTTVRYGDAIFGKVVRRLREGINPDEEMSRFLADRTSFRHLPVPYGSAFYQTATGVPYPVGVLFSFVPSIGDGWGWTQDQLATASLTSYAGAARRLGERTGQLHVALVSVDTDPDFAPEPVTDADMASWEQTTSAAVGAIRGELSLRFEDLPRPSQASVQAMLDRQSELIDRLAGFRALAGTVKTRIHGDYHLGQTLRTPDADWVLLDFEGEPARTIEQRRTKTAPMKDVADMLRSFGYARGMAARSPAADRPRLAAWEQEARSAFLAGYRGEVARSPVPLVPADDDAFDRAVAAWELAKAIYEVRYELGNRPDWLDVPLSSLIVRREHTGH